MYKREVQGNNCSEARKIAVYIDANTIITAGALLGATTAIAGVAFSAYRWYLKQNKQDEEIERMKGEQCLLTYGILACLKGLKEQGCNGLSQKRLTKSRNILINRHTIRRINYDEY